MILWEDASKNNKNSLDLCLIKAVHTLGERVD